MRFLVAWHAITLRYSVVGESPLPRRFGAVFPNYFNQQGRHSTPNSDAFHTAASAKYVVENWPDDAAPIVFSGYEIGIDIITGTGYQHTPSSPMKRAYELAYNSLIVGRPKRFPGPR